MQRVVSGVDAKANKLYVEQEALVAFTTMRQGAMESTDGFITCVTHMVRRLSWREVKGIWLIRSR